VTLFGIPTVMIRWLLVLSCSRLRLPPSLDFFGVIVLVKSALVDDQEGLVSVTDEPPTESVTSGKAGGMYLLFQKPMLLLAAINSRFLPMGG
jgi:hypothetical protein